jgi:hypothetical protein
MLIFFSLISTNIVDIINDDWVNYLTLLDNKCTSRKVRGLIFYSLGIAFISISSFSMSNNCRSSRKIGLDLLRC